MSLTFAGAAVAAHLQDLHAQGVRSLGVAVSGGGDSLALLDLAVPLARGLGLRLEAATVDHRLRPEAADEARAVARYCAGQGVPHEILIWDGSAALGNIQAAARAGRYQALASWAQRRGLARVMIAHNIEDLAETFLIRLGRAAGLDGLAAMAPCFTRDGVQFTRPLLAVPGADLRAHLMARGLPWAEDPGNQDSHYTRVKMRRLLADLSQAGITAQAIAHSARALSDSRAWIERLVAEAWEARVTVQGGDLLIRALPGDEEAARRLLIAALQIVGGSAWTPRHRALQDLRDRLAEQKRHTLAGCLITRQGEALRISREYQRVHALTAPPGAWWDNRWRITGPDTPQTWTAALGAGLAQVADWRDFTDLPRASLLASPAIWGHDGLIAAPLARNEPQWQVELRKGFGTLPFLH